MTRAKKRWDINISPVDLKAALCRVQGVALHAVSFGVLYTSSMLLSNVSEGVALHTGCRPPPSEESLLQLYFLLRVLPGYLPEAEGVITLCHDNVTAIVRLHIKDLARLVWIKVERPPRRGPIQRHSKMIRYLKRLGLEDGPSGSSFGDYAKTADENVMAAFHKR
ncbi:hypothetical protein DFH09DRAFT_1101190 [Mycena vulgaris]|nr:hypothetical protein DFH09DRAFT_1101190 [Mycena vulgaris]